MSWRTFGIAGNEDHLEIRQALADVVAAVNFAREHNLRLVIKGRGHSYQGTSCATDSLLIWTREMKHVAVQEAFVGRGCEGKQTPQPAVTVGAGALWRDAYDAVTTRGGRYVQGGGCLTVGVAGLVQSGGFGGFSKNYGWHPQRCLPQPLPRMRRAFWRCQSRLAVSSRLSCSFLPCASASLSFARPRLLK